MTAIGLSWILASFQQQDGTFDLQTSNPASLFRVTGAASLSGGQWVWCNAMEFGGSLTFSGGNFTDPGFGYTLIQGSSQTITDSTGLLLATIMSINKSAGTVTIAAGTTVYTTSASTRTGATLLSISGTIVMPEDMTWTFPITVNNGGQISKLNDSFTITMTNASLTFSSGSSWNGIASVIYSITTSTAQTFQNDTGTAFPILVRHGSGSGSLTFLSASTITVLQDNDGLVAHTLTFPAGATMNFGTFSVSGSSGKRVSLRSSTPGVQHILHSTGAAQSADWLDIQDSRVDASPRWSPGSNSLDSGDNTNWFGSTPTALQGSGGVSKDILVNLSERDFRRIRNAEDAARSSLLYPALHSLIDDEE